MYILTFYCGTNKEHKSFAVAYSEDIEQLQAFADGHYVEGRDVYVYDSIECFDYGIINTRDLIEI